VPDKVRRDVGLDLAGVSAKTESSFTFSGLSNASSTGMTTTDFLNMERGAGAAVNKDSTTTEPSWMTDVLKTPREGPLSARSNSDISFAEPSRTKPSSAQPSAKEVPGKSLDVFNAEEEDGPSSSRPGSRRQAAAARSHVEDSSGSLGRGQGDSKPSSRGSRRKAQEQETAVQPAPSATSFKPRKSRRQTKQEEEEKLRQSMDALNASDRHNRGRLEQELTTVSGGRHEAGGGSSTMPKISESSDGNDSGVDMSPLSLEATVAVNLSNRRMRALEELSGGVLDKELVGDQPPGGHRRMLRQRSERIDQVQEKVTSALASLAGMMATLPGSTRQQQQPEHAQLNLSPIHKNMPVPGPSSSAVSGELLDRSLDTSGVPLDDDIDDILAESYLESSVYDIPVLPKGRIMELEVLSTWGDPYYVGLNGIDIFDHHGDILLLNEGIDSIEADPSDINVLSEYHDDPRTIANVLDGMNFTRDDLHVWLAPHGHTLTPRLPYVANITVALTKFTTISLIRIWNYNKSRTHCYRGVRRCRIKLDNRVVFEGEIRAAPGLATSCEDCSEVILFTTDSVVLGKVAAYDASMGYLSGDLTEHETNVKWMEQLKGQKAYLRPRTADKSTGAAQAESSAPPSSSVLSRRKQASVKPEGSFEPTHTRPTTAAVRPSPAVDMNSSSRSVPADLSTNVDTTTDVPDMSRTEPVSLPLARTLETTSNIMQLKRRDLFDCKILSFVIEKTWGDKCYVGLAGIEVLIGQNCIVTDIDPSMIDADPRDLSAIGCYDDPRTPDKLVNGINDTTDDKNMWLIPYTVGTSHQLKIDFGTSCSVAGFNIWNYNKSPEDALRGVRVMSVFADGKIIGRCEVRMAPGCDGVVGKQTIMLRDITDNELRSPIGLRYITPSVRQDYETLVLPSGTCWRFNLYCNWGDGYYIGLDGLQMLDEKGKEILLESSHCRIEASPHSLCDLGMQDARLPRNLSSAPFHDPSGSMAWLAPLAQCMTEEERRNSLRYTVGRSADKDFDPLFYDQNVLYVMFDRPVSVSVIRYVLL
jgi:hypothetical protein